MSRQTRWIYRDMLDVYYDSEKPLSLDLDVLCDEIGAESDDERRIVEKLLRFKFVKSEDGYVHETCDRVIAEYRQKAETAKANGKLGGRPRKGIATDDKPSGLSVGSDPVSSCMQESTELEANQEPRTKNQNQEPKETTPPPAAEYSPEFEIAWSGYPERPGANKKNAYKAWNARLKAGVDFTQMTLGVDRYAYYCSVMKVEPQFIKQPETFFGPSEHYLSDWKPVAASAGVKNIGESLDEINARNNAEAKRLLFGTPSEVRTINA